MIGSLVRISTHPRLRVGWRESQVGTVIDRAIADRVMVLWSDGNTETIDPYYLEVIDA